MAEYQVSCPHCQTALDADVSLGGQVVDCPACAGKIHLPVVKPAVRIAQPVMRLPGSLRAPEPPPRNSPSKPARMGVGKSYLVSAAILGVYAVFSVIVLSVASSDDAFLGVLGLGGLLCIFMGIAKRRVAMGILLGLLAGPAGLFFMCLFPPADD